MSKNTFIIDHDKIEAFIHRAVQRALASQVGATVHSDSEKRWLTKSELKELTGWSDRTIQHLRDTRQIPFSQHGRKILYPTEGIEKLLRDHLVQPRST